MLRLTALALLLMFTPAGAETPRPGMMIGVTTHFGQGWPERYWRLLETIPVQMVRDNVAWAKVESIRGVFRFDERNSGFVRRICAMGKRVLLVADPRNPLYDGGRTAFTGPARAAYARFVSALGTQFGGCVTGVEIGNEINGKNAVTGPAAIDRTSSHVALVKDVANEVKSASPELLLLGGSSLSVATGFVSQLLDAGLAGAADGLAIHPYRADPTNLDWEIAHLSAVMAAHGRPLPLWATEFSSDFTTPEDGAPFAIRMIAQMDAADVRGAFWYALVDQPGFPNMGLFTTGGVLKPAGVAVSRMTRLLTGQALRIGESKELGLYHYRIGSNVQLFWGLPRSYSISAKVTVTDSMGHPLPLVGQVSDAPVIVEGPAAIRFGPARVLADSLYGYGRAPWTYSIQRAHDASMPLMVVDGNWTSTLSSPALRSIIVNQSGLVPAGGGAQPVLNILSYTANIPGQARLQACLRRGSSTGDGATFAALVDDRPVVAQRPIGDVLSIDEPINLKVGARVDFVVGPGKTALGDLTRYRYRIATRQAPALLC